MLSSVISKQAAPLAVLFCAMLLSGCTQSDYYGINLKPVANNQPTKIQSLASRAKSGGKEAQLELGILFEAGRNGLNKDLKKAKALYQEAARDIALTQTTFTTEDNIVKSQTTTTGKTIKGLEEAKARLESLEHANSAKGGAYE